MSQFTVLLLTLLAVAESSKNLNFATAEKCLFRASGSIKSLCIVRIGLATFRVCRSFIATADIVLEVTVSESVI